MKKYLFLLMAIAGMAFTFASCSSDDDEAKGNPLVGTWVSFDYNINDTIIFSKDGTAIEHAGKADGSALSRSKGHYSVAGNKLTLHWTSGLKWDKIIKRWTAIKDPEETNIITFELKGRNLKFTAMEGETDYPVTTFKKQ